MPKALGLLCAGLAGLLLGMIGQSSVAFGADVEVLVYADQSCGGPSSARRLAEQLSIRLPEKGIGLELGDSVEALSWQVIWHRSGRCVVDLISTRNEERMGRWQLDERSDDEDLFFVISRVAWVVSLEEDGGLLGPPEELEGRIEAREEREAVIAEPEIPEEAIEEIEEPEEPEEPEEVVSRQDPPRDQERTPLERWIAGELGEELPEEARPEEEISEAPRETDELEDRVEAPGSNGEYTLWEQTRITLFPGAVVKGRHLEMPLLSLNGIGRSAHFLGTEVGVINIIETSAEGVQLGLGNRVEGTTVGLQLAGFANQSGPMRGAQIATFFNVAGEEIQGLQLASGFNHAARGKGLQAASLVNHTSEDWHGAQVGLVNVAHRVKGAQVGLVNISRESSAPIGLVNVVLDHPPRVKAWLSLPGYNYTSLETGGKNLRYSLLFGGRLGLDPDAIGERVLGLGLGWRFYPRDNFFLDVELSALTHTYELGRLFERGGRIQQLRGTIAWQALDRVAPMAGIGITRMREGDTSFVGSWSASLGANEIWPELLLGVVF